MVTLKEQETLDSNIFTVVENTKKDNQQNNSFFVPQQSTKLSKKIARLLCGEESTQTQ